MKNATGNRNIKKLDFVADNMSINLYLITNHSWPGR